MDYIIALISSSACFLNRKQSKSSHLGFIDQRQIFFTKNGRVPFLFLFLSRVHSRPLSKHMAKQE